MGCAVCSGADADVKTAALAPTLVEDLVIRDVLGVGGFGLVREVHFLGSEDAFAMKSVSKRDLLCRSNGIQAVFQELHALQVLRLAPPDKRRFVCQLHLAFQDDRFVYLVLDLCPGGDMRCNLNRTLGHRFSESVARFFAAQVFLALDACHKVTLALPMPGSHLQMHVLHRDCKPENIVMCSNGYIKLTDFGVAKALADVDKCYSTSGTHGYIAPEVYASPHLHGRTADWFAAGVTLHEMLTGHRPFDACRLAAFRDGANEDRLGTSFLMTRPALSAAGKEFTSRCLERYPQSRMGARSGFNEIAEDPWFADFDWEGLLEQRIPAPMAPILRGNTDLNSADTLRVIRAHLQSPAISAAEDARFRRLGSGPRVAPPQDSKNLDLRLRMTD